MTISKNITTHDEQNDVMRQGVHYLRNQHNRLGSVWMAFGIKHVENYLFFLKFLIRNERENIVDDKFLVSCKLYPSHTVPFQIYF